MRIYTLDGSRAIICVLGLVGLGVFTLGFISLCRLSVVVFLRFWDYFKEGGYKNINPSAR